MYLARYESAEGGELVQGVVRAEGEPTDGSAAGLWREQIHDLGAMVEGLGPVGIELRLAVHPERPAERVLAVTCPAGQEIPLQRCLAAFTRLERTGTVRVETVREAASARLNEILAESLPRHRGRVADGPPLTAGGAWLIPPWRIHERLGEVARRALLAGHAFSYIAHLTEAEPDPELLRAARRNMLSLERTPGVPAALIADQRARVELFARSRVAIDDYMAVDDATAWEWLDEVVSTWKPPTAGVRWSVVPSLRETNAEENEALASGLPVGLLFGAEDMSPAERIARCVEPETLAALLGWTSPEPRPAEAARLAEAMLPTLGAPLRCAAQPYVGDESYAFVSYACHDAIRVADIVDRLAARGIRLWYDTGIPGGVEWDAHIEERLDQCSAVLLFLSPAAAASRYVRREVKYADARGKPLLPVMLEQVRLGGGLGMLLSAVQMLNAGQPELIERLEQAFLRAAAI